MAVARKLKNLSIREVSSVTRGAGENVRVLLMKRDDADGKTQKNKVTLEDAITKAVGALALTIKAINEADDVEDRDAALLKGISDFNTHMADVIGLDAGDDVMSKELEAQIAKLSSDLAFAKMTDPHKTYANTMKLEGDALKKFVEADDAGREAIMKEFPPKKEKKPGDKEDDGCEKKIIKMDDLPQEVIAKLAQADEDKKILKGLQETAEVKKYEDKAVELGLAKSHGDTIRKAFSGNAEAQGKLEALLKGLTEQVRTGKVFEQFGNEGKQATNAMDEIRAKADELRKTETKLSSAQAIDKVLSDPANAELAKRERDERMVKIGGGVRAA